jgi:DNA-binding LacI/PurR family transcriptional regulator
MAKRKSVTLKDVAEKVGVSRQTVSRVINDKPGVADETRQRVRQTIEDLGYRPNLAARGLSRNQTHTVGFVIPYSPTYLANDPHLLKQMSAVDQVLGLRGYTMLLTTAIASQSRNGTARADDEELSAFHRLTQTSVADGVLISETPAVAEGIRHLEDHAYPWVIIGYSRGLENAHAVHADDRGGARQAIMHLLSLGHHRIGVISGAKRSIVAIEERLAGCRLALEEHNLQLDPAMITYGDFTVESGAAAAQQLMLCDPAPTAIFAFNDRMALGALQYLQAHGWSVPKDISVMGFDDVPITRMCTPNLTTVQQPASEMGQQAARLLIDLIEGRNIASQAIVLPTVLRVRGSTGPVHLRTTEA